MSADETTIRRLGPEDLELLIGIQPGLFDNPVDPDQARAFLENPLHHIIMAFAGIEAVSFASATVLLHPDKPPTMFINEVGTRDEWQRRGLATRVTRAMIDHGRALGCDGVWLGTETDNAAAIALYRSLNADAVDGIYFGWDDAL